MPSLVPYIEESPETKRAFNAANRAVREAALRQASDIATAVYHAWNTPLTTAGLTWQAFQSAASAKRDPRQSWLKQKRNILRFSLWIHLDALQDTAGLEPILER